MSSESESAVTEPLQFDRVVHADPETEAAMRCAQCGASIAGTYYHDGDRTLCDTCGAARQAESSPDRRARTLLRALALGLGAAIIGGILYWAVMEYLDLQLGLVAIAIGYVVGRAVAKATRGRSARRHRILAVTLTYLAVAIAYAPFMIKEWRKGTPAPVAADSTSVAVKRDSASTPAAAPAVTPAEKADSTAKKAEEPLTLGGFLIALGAVAGLLFALPVMASLMSMPSGLLSLLIIGFGLKQAWNVAGASNSEVVGPLAVTGTTP
jgi:hypothetical protein